MVFAILLASTVLTFLVGVVLTIPVLPATGDGRRPDKRQLHVRWLLAIAPALLGVVVLA